MQVKWFLENIGLNIKVVDMQGEVKNGRFYLTLTQLDEVIFRWSAGVDAPDDDGSDSERSLTEDEE